MQKIWGGFHICLKQILQITWDCARTTIWSSSRHVVFRLYTCWACHRWATIPCCRRKWSPCTNQNANWRAKYAHDSTGTEKESILLLRWPTKSAKTLQQKDIQPARLIQLNLVDRRYIGQSEDGQVFHRFCQKMFSHRQIPKNDPRTGSQPSFHSLNDAIALESAVDLKLSIDGTHQLIWRNMDTKILKRYTKE